MTLDDFEKDIQRMRVLPACLLNGTDATKTKTKTKKEKSDISPIIEKSIFSMLLTELCDHCKVRKLPRSGRKADLIARIQEYEKLHMYKNWPSERLIKQAREEQWVMWNNEYKSETVASRGRLYQ
jgi:hypothetical protein